MDITGQTEQPTDASAKSRQKRSRTGCLTCRTRRRKCDEGRPKCRSCISKGFECRYAAAFQILGKNNFTPEVSTKGGYKELQFVREYSGKDDKKKSDDEEVEEAHPKDTSNPVIESEGPQQSTSPQSGRSIKCIQDTQSHSPSAERYEFALHGLLALGNGNNDGDINGEPEVNFASIDFAETDHATLPRQPSVAMNQFHTAPNPIVVAESQERPKMQSWPSISAISSVEIPHMTDERILELLKHYRYNIAPWMDICDMKQGFGCEALQLCKNSSPVQLEILALAEASLGARHQIQDVTADMLACMQRRKVSSGEEVHESLLHAFEIVKAVVTNLSGFWSYQDSVWYTRNVLEPLLFEVNGDPSGNSDRLARSTFWLLARLQLSVALMSPATVRIPLPTASISAWEYVSAGDAERVFRYAHDAAALCIDATVFSHGDEDRWLQQQYGLNRVELWETLVAGNERWYKHRPQEFQPIIELYPRDAPTSEDGFPTLVFSSGATTLANQLYHTGMLLLLQNKPRFMDRPHSQSPSMSALWHAHRVCGISLSNDRWDCWDPSLVASLLVAAKTITHRSQHKAILNTLESVQQFTGWNISHHVEQLAIEWQQADGW